MNLDSSQNNYKLDFNKLWFVYDHPGGSEEYGKHKGLLFHVNHGDYFSTLASILRFYEESIKEGKIDGGMQKIELKTISKVIEDLLYLDKNFSIIPKKEE
jgi:hypothetical protein